MKNLRNLSSLFILSGLLIFSACKDDDEPQINVGPLAVTSISAAGTDPATGENVSKDLASGATASDVPMDAVFTVTFSKAVDASTITDANVQLTQGGTAVGTNLATNGAVVTITPTAELAEGTEYTLTLGSGIMAEDGGVFTQTTRTFMTASEQQQEMPQLANMAAYWDFDGAVDESTGTYTTGFNQVTGYEEDRFGNAESAVRLNGEGDMIDIENSADLTSSSMTLSFWMMMDVQDPQKVEHNFFIMGAGAERGFMIETGGAGTGDTWMKFPTSHVNADGSGYSTAWSDAVNGNGQSGGAVTYQWEGDLEALIDEQWVHVVMTFDEGTSIKSMYINGELMRREDLSMLEPALGAIEQNSTDVQDVFVGDFAIGFAGSSTNTATGWADYSTNPRTFSGLLDDIRVFSVALTEEEVATLYNIENP
ncbi:MAG: Ig-like domain-containing protein [Bacteroidetes bacterium]|nr:Ig-like domain-containing protein [Bacteroidota bacterium]